MGTGADAVIIDLEDAVPLSMKEETRAIVREKVEQYRKKTVFVRINSLDTGFAEKDIAAVVTQGLFGIMAPMIESREQIQTINTLLLEAEKQEGLNPGAIRVLPLVETAFAVENAYEIARVKSIPDRMLTLAFGAADFSLDMGIEITKTGEELFYARSRLAVACRAASIAPPIDTPYMTDLKDTEALKADIMWAKKLGFQGKLCIHPNQIEPVNRIFSPTDEEIAWAEKVVSAFAEAEKKGSAAIQVDGKFIDYPVVERSKRILKLAGRKQAAS